MHAAAAAGLGEGVASWLGLDAEDGTSAGSIACARWHRGRRRLAGRAAGARGLGAGGCRATDARRLPQRAPERRSPPRRGSSPRQYSKCSHESDNDEIVPELPDVTVYLEALAVASAWPDARTSSGSPARSSSAPSTRPARSRRESRSPASAASASASSSSSRTSSSSSSI